MSHEKAINFKNKSPPFGSLKLHNPFSNFFPSSDRILIFIKNNNIELLFLLRYFCRYALGFDFHFASFMCFICFPIEIIKVEFSNRSCIVSFSSFRRPKGKSPKSANILKMYQIKMQTKHKV